VTFVAGILLASLAGSLHCAAMCGAFVCAYAGRSARPSVGAHVGYHAGRLASYLVLGAAAGAIGAGVDRVGLLAGVSRAAAIAAGVLMVLWALGEIGRLRGVRVPELGTGAARRALGGVLLVLRDRAAWQRATALGLLTTLIPCGWLYAFVATAGATGTATSGAGVMLVFWAGTLPMLALVGAGARRFLAPAARRLPAAAALLVLALGVLSITGRLRPPTSSHAIAVGTHAGH
jgi:sulfite exporter TauE/SafE